MKTTTQLIIAAMSLTAALAIAFHVAPAMAAAGQQDCTEYCETGAAFIADYATAHAHCKGNRACINKKWRNLTGNNRAG